MDKQHAWRILADEYRQAIAATEAAAAAMAGSGEEAAAYIRRREEVPMTCRYRQHDAGRDVQRAKDREFWAGRALLYALDALPEEEDHRAACVAQQEQARNVSYRELHRGESR